MWYFEIIQEDDAVVMPPDKPERDQKGKPSTDDRQALSAESDLARQREVMLSVIDRAAPLFKALAKK